MREPRIPVIGHRPGGDPLPGAVTLPELTAALRRFELRPDLNPDATEDEAARQLSAWSPTLPGPDADEGPYLSCVVLEYGGGEGAPVTPEEASRRWSGRFHLVYSAWSHREAQPRFRLVLPLEHLVPVGAWPRVWAWAVDRAGEGVDRTRPSPAARYPLPAVPDEDAPRVAFSRPGALLDPHAAGLLEAPVAHPAAASGPAGDAASVLRGEEPDARYLDHVDDSAVYFVDEGWDDGGWEDEPWVEAGTAEEPPGPGDALEAEVEAPPAGSSTIADDLDRLLALASEGFLDPAELAKAKRLVLGLDARSDPPSPPGATPSDEGSGPR
jgi:hypothetical protein